MKLTLLLQIAGVLHLSLLCAGATMPRAVKLHAHLTTLPTFIRRLVWVYYGFIGSSLAAFGLLTFIFAAPMAAGEPVARGLCTFLALFWTARLAIAALVFDVRPYLTNWFYWIGYQALNLVFIYLTAIYAWAAWNGGTL
jgi:hypothetical protein